jgi:hypothetical protein
MVIILGIFSNFEDRLEKYIEGIFDHYKGRIRPLEVAVRLNRAMRDLKQVSVNHIFVPNQYTILLSTEDYQAMSSLFVILSKELEHYLQEKAIEKNYTLLGPVKIIFKPEDSLKAGHMNVEGFFSEEKYTTKKEVLDLHQNTLFFSPNEIIVPEKKDQVKKISLKITDGPCRGQEITLSNFPAIIGRQADCDIIIRDSSVSRRHARLEFEKDNYLLIDLKSTNGTFVNGKRISSRKLQPGDRIKVGSSVLNFKVRY